MSRRRSIDHAKIRALYREGKTYRQIAKEVGCHVNTVRIVTRDIREDRRYSEEANIAYENVLVRLKLLRERLRDNIKRARNVGVYCEWTARTVVRDLWDEYRHLREVKRRMKG